tara:strand:+ start:1345 stop:2106 length:762 start_codon:yes stop_codon:yes gene_type:complete
MAALPDLSAMTLNTHTELRENAQVGVYMPQTKLRPITDSRGVLAPDVDRDGQCLFHCLSKLWNRTSGKYKTTEQVIKDIKKHLDKHWERMAKEHGEKSVKAEYIKNVGGIWGGQLEIDAACEIYNVNIFEWWSVDAALRLPDETALYSAVLSAKYHPRRGTNAELKALADWDLFLHHGHFRYLEKTISTCIHDAAAQAAFQRAPAGGVCHTEPLPDPDELATMRLISELVAQEEQAKSDAEAARTLYKKWSLR